MDLDKLKEKWLKAQYCEIFLNQNQPDVPYIFQIVHNSQGLFNEYWMKENDKTLYKQVIHLEEVNSIELLNLATHCFIHKLMCEITANSWKNNNFVKIELFKRDLFEKLVENEIEKKTLLEA